MEYATAKKKHPNLKVRNVKRLIKAISESDPLDLARVKAAKKPLKVGKRKATCRDADVNSEKGMANPRVPLVFFMAAWMSPAPVDDPDDIGYVSPFRVDWPKMQNEPTCGTAACIAGFAGALSPKPARVRLRKDLRHMGGRCWARLLAEFLGIGTRTADRMVSVGNMGHLEFYNRDVQPRHAVAMLENFLETGKVEWKKAMGRNSSGRRTAEELEAMCMDERALSAA